MTSPMRAPRPTPRRAPQPAEVRPSRPHLRVVEAPSRHQGGRRSAPRRRHTGAVVVATMAIVFGSLLVSAVFHGLLASGQTRLDRLDSELQQERASLAREQLELADLRSPQRISAAATELGMVPADTQHWVSAATGDETVIRRSGNPATDDVDQSPEPDGSTDGSTDGATNELAGGADGTGAR